MYPYLLMEDDMNIARDSRIFEYFENNYWKYYKELENEFLQTRRYVEFCAENMNTYSVEYLKLYQAVCSEIDVIGKAMAKLANSSFSPEDKKNSIYKWWYEIQSSFYVTDGPFTFMNFSPEPKQYKLNEYKCIMQNDIVLFPWNGFVIEKSVNERGNDVFVPKNNARIPDWWKDYNKVKHNRTSIVDVGSRLTNYSKANLNNLSASFAALYILERGFMDTVGTHDNLSSFMDFSKLFEKRRKYTYDEMNVLLNYSQFGIHNKKECD